MHDRVAFNYALDWTNPTTMQKPNTQVAQRVVEAFLCPSDGTNRKGLMDGRANVGGAWAVNNYKAVAGGNWDWGDHVDTYQQNAKFNHPNDNNGHNGLDRGNGFICRNAGNLANNYINMSSIIDGTSNTFAVGEAVPSWCNHTWWYWFNGSTATCGIPLNYRKGRGAGFLAINYTDWNRNYSFFSMHPGGAQFTMGDASTRFVNDSIDINLYRFLATISGGEPAQAP